MTQISLPPPTRAVGTVDPPGDMNLVSTALSAMQATGWVTPSGDNTGATDTANISAALSANTAVLLAPGTFYVDAATAVPSGATVQGSGTGLTVINQVSTSANGFTCTDSVGVTIRDLTISGPSSGTGIGISFVLSGRANCYRIVLDNVLAENFGSHGIAMATPIVSAFRAVVAQGNGGDGWHVTGGGTSCAWDGCYANANTANGWSLNAQNYSSLNGCASDSSGTNGYLLTSCSQVSLHGCGAEASAANGFEVTGGFGTSLVSCYVTLNAAIAAWVTGGAVAAFITGFREASTTGSPTASIKVDGSSTCLIGINNTTTATSFANGTTTIISNNTFQCPGSTGTSSYIINRLATSNIASLTFQTASTGQWNVELVNNSTNDLIVRDAVNAGTAATFEQHAAGPNIQLLTGAKSFAGGIGVIGIGNAGSVPTSTPANGGVLYVQGGALKYVGSAGTITQLGPA